jgi:hypothetical protein
MGLREADKDVRNPFKSPCPKADSYFVVALVAVLVEAGGGLVSSVLLQPTSNPDNANKNINFFI